MFLKVRPHIPELQHIFQNNEIPTPDNCIEIPMETYSSSNNQEIQSNQMMNMNTILDNNSMVFSTADLNSGNFQGEFIKKLFLNVLFARSIQIF